MKKMDGKKVRRINIYGAPSSGKSTTSAWLFAHLKMANFNIEFVGEAIKRHACMGRPIVSFDQLYWTTQQIIAEDEYLRSGTPYIITECPVMISYLFAKRNKLHYADALISLGRHVEEIYPSVNVYLKRDIPYKKEGRYETEDEAQYIDQHLREFLENEYRDLIVSSPKEKDKLLEILKNAIS